MSRAHKTRQHSAVSSQQHLNSSPTSQQRVSFTLCTVMINRTDVDSSLKLLFVLFFLFFLFGHDLMDNAGLKQHLLLLLFISYMLLDVLC